MNLLLYAILLIGYASFMLDFKITDSKGMIKWTDLIAVINAATYKPVSSGIWRDWCT